MATDNRTFYTRVGVTLAAAIVVMGVAKFLFFPRSSPATAGPSPAPTSQLTEGSSPSSDAAPQSSSSQVISWQDAARHYGEHCTVEGTIVATRNTGKVCFLNFHANYRKYFTAVIFASRFSHPANPEDFYKGRKVRMTGLIKEYQGKPEIVLESPNQIETVH